MVLKRYKRNIKKEKRIAKRKSMALANKININKRHKKISSKIRNCQARPRGEINLPISRKYERAIKFLLLLNIIMRKFFMFLSELRGYPNSILHIIISIYYLVVIQLYSHYIPGAVLLPPVLCVLILILTFDFGVWSARHSGLNIEGVRIPHPHNHIKKC